MCHTSLDSISISVTLLLRVLNGGKICFYTILLMCKYLCIQEVAKKIEYPIFNFVEAFRFITEQSFQ